MSELHKLIAELRSKGMFLSAEENKLVIKGPKGTITEAMRDLIVSNKPEMIRILQEENSEELRKVEVRPARIPLSYAQERLWFLAKLGQSGQYHIPGFLHFDGKPLPEFVKKAFQILVDRHESLRTCFREENGEAYQLILDEMEIDCEHVVMKDKNVKDPAVTAVTSKFASDPFDMVNGPLIRIIVIELQGRFVIGYCMHHIIGDGWSITILQQELNAIFRAFYEKKEPQLEPLPVHFADYAIWQRKVLSREKLADKIEHWKQHLSGYQDLNFPLDFPRPEALSGRGGMESVTLNLTKSHWLRDYCKTNNITLFSLLLASVYALLKRYSNQNDICIGLPIANRNHKAIEKMIGFFANTVVNRMIMEEDITMERLIALSQKELLRSQDYQDVPFSRIVDAVQPAREASKTPIFQVLVNYVNVANQKIRIGTDSSRNVEFEYSTSKFDLNFTFSEGAGEAVTIGIEYSTDLFLPDTIKRILKHYELIIENVIRDVSVQVNKINLETSAENQLFARFNETELTGWEPATLHSHLFGDRLEFPDRIAVEDEAGSLTYYELAEQSSILAERLRASGSARGAYVGICLERSREMIIAIVATLKTGAAYVTIDPKYPADRIQYIIEDSSLKILITDAKKTDAKPFADVTSVINITDQVVGTEQIDRHIPDSVRPADAAYLIYTSGSTGRPKGVIQTHQTIDNLSWAKSKYWNLDQARNKKTGQFASASFDVSVQEIFFALKNYQTLVITSHQVKRSPADYVRLVEDSELNFIFLPTAYLDIFASESINSARQYPKLERIVVAGEALRITAKIREFFKSRPHIRLENHYGPTETHVATMLTLEDKVENWRFFPTIGKPVPHFKAYILNKAMTRTPFGGIGELYLSGKGVAKGYLNNETLTRERFIENPFGVETLYKTGDLGRWLPNGEIEFYGRVDEQIKIRGYRVEIGEVEKAILEFPGVDLASVIVRERGEEKQLVAFYTAEAKIDAADIRMAMQKTLPNYMMPSAMMQLDELPYNGSGKVDRHQLKAIELGNFSGNEYKAPESETEKMLAGLWQKLLGVRQIGADDNFFELGGHSLLAVKLVSLINKNEPDSKLQVMDVLKYPVLSSLAKYLESGNTGKKSSPYILTFSEPGAVIIVPGMPGLSDGYHDMAVRLKRSQGVYGLQMKGFDDSEPLSTIEDMAAHNLELISEILPSGKLEIYGHSYGGTVIYEMLKQIDKDRYDIGQLVFLDSSPHKPVEGMTPASAIALTQGIMWKYLVREEKYYHEIADLIRNQAPESWKDQISAFLDLRIDGFERSFFEKMWKVVEVSMSAQYTMSGPLAYDLKMIIPNASIGMVDEQAWEPYFRNVETSFTGGDHFSMITAGYCNEWIEKLSQNKEKTPEKLI